MPKHPKNVCTIIKTINFTDKLAGRSVIPMIIDALRLRKGDYQNVQDSFNHI
jgi:hypothetical protein